MGFLYAFHKVFIQELLQEFLQILLRYFFGDSPRNSSKRVITVLYGTDWPWKQRYIKGGCVKSFSNFLIKNFFKFLLFFNFFSFQPTANTYRIPLATTRRCQCNKIASAAVLRREPKRGKIGKRKPASVEQCEKYLNFWRGGCFEKKPPIRSISTGEEEVWEIVIFCAFFSEQVVVVIKKTRSGARLERQRSDKLNSESVGGR